MGDMCPKYLVAWIHASLTNLVKYVLDMRNKMSAMTEVAKENMRVQQDRQKYYYEKKSRMRSYSVGNTVLILLPSDSSKITDTGDMCPKYLAAWIQTSLTWFLEHH
jgi:hypothetical protein